MRRYVGGLLLLCMLLVQPVRLIAQHPLDEGQQKLIGINAHQQKQLEEVFSKAGPKRRAIQAKLHELYDELHQLYDTYTFDQQKANSLREQILEQHRQLMALFAANEVKLRGILNPDQFQRLKALLKSEWEHRQHEHNSHGPDRFGGDHGPKPPGDHGDAPVGQTIGQRKY
jgi:Spy/CpxP family protein refolding chaperone